MQLSSAEGHPETIVKAYKRLSMMVIELSSNNFFLPFCLLTVSNRSKGLCLFHNDRAVQLACVGKKKSGVLSIQLIKKNSNNVHVCRYMYVLPQW